MDVNNVTVKTHIKNLAELKAEFEKTLESVGHLVKAGILRIPEDVSVDDIEERAKTAFVNAMKLG